MNCNVNFNHYREHYSDGEKYDMTGPLSSSSLEMGQMPKKIE